MNDRVDLECRVFVGNLPSGSTSAEVTEMFEKYGKISYVDVKTHKRPMIAFVQFAERRAAREACREMDDFKCGSSHLRVNMARMRSIPLGTGDTPGRYSNPTTHICLISGLPPRTKRQDMVNHFHPIKIGEFCIYEDGEGSIEFFSRKDLEYAKRETKGRRLHTKCGESAHIEYNDVSGRVKRSSYARASRSRSRSPTRSRSRSRQQSRSRSQSPYEYRRYYD